MGWKYRDPETNEWKNSVGSDGWIDITLSQSGLAADAKTTGDKIDATKIEANEYTDDKIVEYIGDTKVSTQIDDAIDRCITGLSVSGKTITYTKGDGNTGTITTQDTNTTYSDATISTSGLMSASDKTKLDGIETDANKYTLPTASSSTLGGVKTTSNVTSNSGYTACPIISGVPYYKDTNNIYTHPTTAGNKHIPSGGSSGQILRWDSDGTAKWEDESVAAADSSLSKTSTNPIQNKAVATAIEDLTTLVGDEPVSDQISKINVLPACTDSDDGKFLCVVNGVATWTTMASGDGVSY